MKKLTFKGLQFAETGYELDSGEHVAVKIIRNDTVNKITLFASARLVDEDGETILKIEPCTYGLQKNGLTQEIIKETLKTAKDDQIERLMLEQDVQSFLILVPKAE